MNCYVRRRPVVMKVSRLPIIGLIFGVLVLNVTSTSGQYTTCYSCIYSQVVSDPNCLYPNSLTSLCTGQQCIKVVGTVPGITTIVRGCSSGYVDNTCFNGTFEATTGLVCACDTNFCNEGSIVVATAKNHILIAILIIAAVFRGF